MEQQIVKYDVNAANIAKMSDLYMSLKVDGIEDTEGFEAVHSGRMVMVKHRTAVDKLRKSSNKDAQAFIKKNNKDAAFLVDAMAPIEMYLLAQESKVTDEKKRLQEIEEEKERKKIKARVDALYQYNSLVPFFEVATLTDGEYETVLNTAKEGYETEQKRLADAEAARVAENERFARIRLEQDAEAKRLQKIADDFEVEKQRVKSEKERLDRLEFERKVNEKAESERRKQAEKTTEKARFESLRSVGFVYPLDDLGIIPEHQYAKMHEEQQKTWDTKQKAILVEELKKEREEKEKADAKKAEQQKALEPDIEQLKAFAGEINKLTIAKTYLKDQKAIEIYENALKNLTAVENSLKLQIKTL